MVDHFAAMKRCTYCGKEYADTETACQIDGQPLTAASLQSPAPKRAKISAATVVRGFAGFIVGSVVASIAATGVFMTICKEPPEVPGEPDYYPDAVMIIVVVTFICGGSIGLRGFTARRASGLLWPVVGSYMFMLLLCLGKEASFHEGAPLIAFASVGIAASVGVSLAVRHWFPQKGLNDVV